MNGGRKSLVFVLVLAVLVLFSARSIASLAIEYQWWTEMGQVPTWVSLMLYRVVPVMATALIAFLVFWITHARALKSAGTGLRRNPVYSKLATLGLAVFSLFFALASIDTWTVVRYFGGRGIESGTGWHDPVFGNSLSFYFFQLPFYGVLLRTLLGITVISAVLYWLAARFWRLRQRYGDLDANEVVLRIDSSFFAGSLEAGFLRGMIAVFLLALAARFYLDRYSMLYDDHRFMTGIEYVSENVALPLVWAAIAAAVLAAILVLLRRYSLAVAMVLVLVLQFVIPRVVSIFVQPSEISLQRPYIQRHIQATRNAYGLNQRLNEVEFAARIEGGIDPSKHKPLLDNVRLWDWRAFHDIVTQIQSLRPYYVFNDTDVDRYTIDGQVRQMLITPREIDVKQLREAQARWINPHFIYTHGYGLVMAEANRITADGSPVLLIQDAPPTVRSASLKVTRPELYYGEVSHEPVFVSTGQPEFDYPSAAADNVHTKYHGRGGFPVSSFLMRLAAALDYGDWNIIITSYLTDQSRMMIHRRVRERLEKLAGFISWDVDPYLVLTGDGRMVWIVDGYTTSDAHPYSRNLQTEAFGSLNYIRNSVKATVDAYDGSVNLFVFDPADPLIQSYRRLFPDLFRNASELPADLRAHLRYPELIFRAQAEIYRTYHMRDPDSFYNKEDLWDFARNVKGQGGESETVASTYIMATLPGETQPEFVLMIPFTPRGKDNLIGLMMARCDGPRLGEIVVLQLSKQALIYGPLQVAALIDQDPNISQNLTLWNQQGSQVLRGAMLVLPVENTFLYVQPIYIQSQSARLPQLKKVVFAVGKRLIYRDTYDEALADLAGLVPAPVQAVSSAPSTPSPPSPAQPAATPDRKLEEIRGHLRRYREFASQGKWAEAGKELEAVEGLVKQ